MSELKQEILKKVEHHLALALFEASKVPAHVANPALLDMTNIEKAQGQLMDLAGLKDDLKAVETAVDALLGRVADFLDVGTISLEELKEMGASLGAEIELKLAEADKPDVVEAEAAAGGAKYRDAIRKEVAKTHTNVDPKGNNVFAHDDGRYFLGYFQKSASSDTEMKFSVNAAIVDDLVAHGPGHIYLVCKDGLIADIPVSELEGKDKPARWEFFVKIEDEEVTAVQGNKRAWDVSFDQFKVGVKGSAE